MHSFLSIVSASSINDKNLNSEIETPMCQRQHPDLTNDQW